MRLKSRILSHPLPDAAIALALTATFLVVAVAFVHAQTEFFSWPEPCAQAGITDPEACRKLMESLSGSTSTLQEPTVVQEPAPTTSDFPEPCRNAGITDPEACKKLMESLFGSTSPVQEPVVTQPPPEFTPPPTPPAETSDCASKCAAVKEECYRNAGGVASELDKCSAAAGACYQACSGGGTTPSSADACLKERCFPLTRECLATTGDSPEALAACEKLIGQCAAGCVKGEGQALTADECVKYTCNLVEGRCMAGEAGSFSQESIRAAGGHIPRCVQAGNDCRLRCRGGQAAAGFAAPPAFTETTMAMPEPCRLKGLKDPEECRDYMISLFKEGRTDLSKPGTSDAPPDFIGEFDAASFLPGPCREKELTDPKDCAELIKRSYVPQLPKECQEAKIADPEECEKLFAKRALLPECREKGAETPEQCQAIIVARNLPPDCVEAKAFDPESCRRLVQDAYLPKACREAGATDERACEKVVFDKYGRPEECASLDDSACRRLIESGKVKDDFLKKIETNELPEKCLELGAKTFEECDRLTRERTMPAECREAGIFSPEGCEKHLFEKYKKIGEDQLRAALPAECREAGVEDPQACRQLMEAKFFPKECVEAGVTDPEGCKKYLQAKYLPEGCRKEGIETADACEEFFRKKHLDPICQAMGLTDRAACEEFVYSRLAEAVQCRGLDASECALAVKGRHLGGILEAKDSIEKIGKRIEDYKSEAGTIDVGGPEERSPEAAEVLEILPFEAADRRRLAVIDSVARVAVTEGDTVETTASVILTYDNDGDAIPDDIEERQGLDPNAPNDKGEIRGDLAPIEQAILGGETLGQPVLEGEIDDRLTVNEAANEDAGLALSGLAPAGEVVALYIYSPLPILVTVTADANGRWKYDFSDQLKDGGHRVYVAVNDETGKVVKKSGPLSLFIREARAASPEEFAASALRGDVNVEETSAVRRNLRWYLLGGAAILLIGAGLAYALMRPKETPSL